jgi:hypothetical protein
MFAGMGSILLRLDKNGAFLWQLRVDTAKMLSCPGTRSPRTKTVGLITGGRAHTLHEFINLAPLEKGTAQLTRLVSKAWGTL